MDWERWQTNETSEVLDVERSATEKDLKNAFRVTRSTLSPRPSEEPDAEEKFKEIQEACCSLGSRQRAHYDRFGHDGPAGNPLRLL